MMELVTRNILWKLFALLIAVLLWIAVANEPELSTFVSVPVEFRDLPDGMEIASNPVEEVELELRGPAGELRSFTGSRTAVVLDLYGITPGQHTYTLNEGHVHLPRGLRLVRVIPPAVRLEFDKVVERSVPVVVQFIGKPERYEVTPSTVTISGPESKIKHIMSVTTDKIDVGEVKGSRVFQVGTLAADSHVRIESDPTIKVQVWMKGN
jgi:YbbR domain-containing protein